MNKTSVLNGQSILDISLQTSGSIESLFSIAALNNLDSLTDSVEGLELINSDVIDDDIVLKLFGKNTPATAMDFIPREVEAFKLIPLEIFDKGQSINVYNQQSLFDIALQTTGSISTIFELAALNNLSSIVSDISNINLITPAVVNKNIVSKLQGNNKPATAGIYNGSLNGEYEVEEYSNEEYNI